MVKAGRDAFERMAEVGDGDAGALAFDLRQGVTEPRLRALAALGVHAAAAAPERMTEIYDNAAAGWLGRDLPASRSSNLDPLPISPAWWRTLWSIATPQTGPGRQRHAERMMDLAGELDPQINPRMAAAAIGFPGVAAAATAGIAQPYDFEWLSQFPPASLGYALSQELMSAGNPASDPYWTSIIPYLRHMPPPLNFINVQAIQSMSLWALVAGYTPRALDRVAMGGFLMGQVGHHYSALASAVTLTAAAVAPPDDLELLLDCLFRGWAHGRETLALVQVSWQPLWSLRVDQVRETLGIVPFASPYARVEPSSPGWSPRIV